MIKKHQFSFVILILLLSPFNSVAAGWGAAISGALRGYTDSRLEDLRRQQEFQYQKQLILYQQELEYQRQLMQQQQLARQLEAAKNAEEGKRLVQIEAEKRAAEDKERQRVEAEIKEINRISAIAAKTENRQRAMSESQLNKLIPKWKSIVSSDNFTVWYANQPAHIQALADSENPDDALKLLKQFKGNN